MASSEEKPGKRGRGNDNTQKHIIISTSTHGMLAGCYWAGLNQSGRITRAQWVGNII